MKKKIVGLIVLLVGLVMPVLARNRVLSQEAKDIRDGKIQLDHEDKQKVTHVKKPKKHFKNHGGKKKAQAAVVAVKNNKKAAPKNDKKESEKKSKGNKKAAHKKDAHKRVDHKAKKAEEHKRYKAEKNKKNQMDERHKALKRETAVHRLDLLKTRGAGLHDELEKDDLTVKALRDEKHRVERKHKEDVRRNKPRTPEEKHAHKEELNHLYLKARDVVSPTDKDRQVQKHIVRKAADLGGLVSMVAEEIDDAIKKEFGHKVAIKKDLAKVHDKMRKASRDAGVKYQPARKPRVSDEHPEIRVLKEGREQLKAEKRDLEKAKKGVKGRDKKHLEDKIKDLDTKIKAHTEAIKEVHKEVRDQKKAEHKAKADKKKRERDAKKAADKHERKMKKRKADNKKHKA